MDLGSKRVIYTTEIETIFIIITDQEIKQSASKKNKTTQPWKPSVSGEQLSLTKISHLDGSGGSHMTPESQSRKRREFCQGLGGKIFFF